MASPPVARFRDGPWFARKVDILIKGLLYLTSRSKSSDEVNTMLGTILIAEPGSLGLKPDALPTNLTH